MSLRLEGHAILWAIALLSLAAAVSRGAVEPRGIAHEGASDAPVSRSSVGSATYLGERPGRSYPRSLPQLSISGRPLFAVLPGTRVEPAPVPVQPEAALPLLKGVISDGIAPKAVFGLAGDPAGYVTAGVGDLAAGYRIERIDADRVVANSPTGESVVLKLRGAGELP